MRELSHRKRLAQESIAAHVFRVSHIFRVTVFTYYEDRQSCQFEGPPNVFTEFVPRTARKLDVDADNVVITGAEMLNRGIEVSSHQNVEVHLLELLGHRLGEGRVVFDDQRGPHVRIQCDGPNGVSTHESE